MEAVTAQDVFTIAKRRAKAWTQWNYSYRIEDNWSLTLQHDEYAAWDASLAGGKSYMVGDEVSMEQYVAEYSTRLTPMQKVAYQWALANPTKQLRIVTPTREWVIYKRGEYVQFGLPYHGQGGENHWISRDGKTKVWVNSD